MTPVQPLQAKGYAWAHAVCIQEFEQLLLGCIKAYKALIASGRVCPNNENKLRDILISDYLGSDNFKERTYNLSSYHFEPETIEGVDGRADIKIVPVDPYRGQKAYYLIECKRLDSDNPTGKSGLNAEYIKNGICRFVSGYYSSFYSLNGMFGFVVSKMDINHNIKFLNQLLPQTFLNSRQKLVSANAISQIQNKDIGESFTQCYVSIHNAKGDKKLTLYHLMFDFSHNIRP